jgi:hypothetical protein
MFFYTEANDLDWRWQRWEWMVTRGTLPEVERLCVYSLVPKVELMIRAGKDARVWLSVDRVMI